MKQYEIALAGQPNAGKSTLYNALTGARQFVANYPGVTVEKKTGFYNFEGYKVNVIDLPGTYSLTAFSLEERVARSVILNDNVDLVVQVIDSTNLSRSLYLTFQILELETSMILVLNMVDAAKKRGIEIDTKKLSQDLKIPVFSTVAMKGIGIVELKKGILDEIQKPETVREFKLDYEELEESIDKVQREVEKTDLSKKYPSRWLAIKYLEDDKEVMELIKGEREIIRV